MRNSCEDKIKIKFIVENETPKKQVAAVNKNHPRAYNIELRIVCNYFTVYRR